MAWIELLKAKDKNNEMFLEMEKDIIRLEIITNRFSKIGSKPSLKNVNVVTVIQESTNYLSSRFADKIQIITSFQKQNIFAAISEVLLHWVIENLCKNAVDAMKGSGEISISLTEEKNHVLINISDTGEGINKSIIKNMFKPGVTSKKRGWGLGLSLCKRIVEDYHNGSLFVVSSEKELGTTFTIKLPKT